MCATAEPIARTAPEPIDILVTGLTSRASAAVHFVWETPVRVDGSAALWREALLASRQASFTSFFNKENKLQLSGRRA